MTEDTSKVPEVYTYKLQVSADENSIIKSNAASKKMAPAEYIKSASLSNGRKRIKDKIVNCKANEALSLCNELLPLVNTQSSEVLDIIMKLKGDITSLCLI